MKTALDGLQLDMRRVERMISDLPVLRKTHPAQDLEQIAFGSPEKIGYNSGVKTGMDTDHPGY